MGFKRIEIQYNPFFFITGNNHHYGREQIEVYSYRLPYHPTTPTQVFPDLKSLFPKTIKDPKTQQDIDNPALQAQGLPLDKDAAVVVGILHVGPFGTGPPGFCHGGMLASISDVIQFLAYAQSDRRAVTGQLNMSYRAPVPLGRVHIFIASVELTGERKGSTRFSIFSSDLTTLHIESNAVFITPKTSLGASLKQTSSDYEDANNKT